MFTQQLPKTLDDVKWNEIKWIVCRVSKFRNGEELVCGIKTEDGQLYQFTTKKYALTNDKFHVSLK